MEPTHSRPTPEDDIAAVLGRFRAWNSDQEGPTGEAASPAQSAGLREISYEEALGVRPVRRIPGVADGVAPPAKRHIADPGSVHVPARMPATNVSATNVARTHAAAADAIGTNSTGTKSIQEPLAVLPAPLPKAVAASVASKPVEGAATAAVRPTPAVQTALPIRRALPAPAATSAPAAQSPVTRGAKTAQVSSGAARRQDQATGQGRGTSKKRAIVPSASVQGGSSVERGVSLRNVKRTGVVARSDNPRPSRKRSPAEVRGASLPKAATQKTAPKKAASPRPTPKNKPVTTFASVLRRSLQPAKDKVKGKAKVKAKTQSLRQPLRAQQPGGSARASSKSKANHSRSGKSQPGKSRAAQFKRAASPSGKSQAANSRSGDAKSVAMKLRISPGDHAKIKAGAAEAGVTLAAYMRLCTLDVQVLRGLLTQTISDLKVIPAAASPQHVETALVRRPHPVVAAAPSEGIMTRLKVLLFGD